MACWRRYCGSGAAPSQWACSLDFARARSWACHHLIVANYVIHSSKLTQRFLAQFGDRMVLHFLPPYCPDDNRWQAVRQAGPD